MWTYKISPLIWNRHFYQHSLLKGGIKLQLLGHYFYFLISVKLVLFVQFRIFLSQPKKSEFMAFVIRVQSLKCGYGIFWGMRFHKLILRKKVDSSFQLQI